MNKQQKIEKLELYLNSLSEENKNDLIFSDYEGKPANLGIKKKIKAKLADNKELIRIILREKENYYSRNRETKEVETERLAHRSALDIWRHFKFYKPDIELWEILQLLWDIKDELRYQYCYDIHKRVFDLKETRGELARHMDKEDEFGLTFIQWNIKEDN